MTKTGSTIYLSKDDDFTFRIKPGTKMETTTRGNRYLGLPIYKHHSKEPIFNGKRWALCSGRECEWCRGKSVKARYLRVPIILSEDGCEYEFEMTGNMMARLISLLESRSGLDTIDRFEIRMSWDGSYSKELSRGAFAARNVQMEIVGVETVDIMTEEKHEAPVIDPPLSPLETDALKKIQLQLASTLNVTYTAEDVAHTLAKRFEMKPERAEQVTATFFKSGKIII